MSSPAAPLADAEWPPEIADLRDGFAGGLNVYRVMAHHPALLRAWSGLRAHVVTRSALGPERLEVVILRTGHRLGSSYEWNQHVDRARTLGFSDARIDTLRGPLAAMYPEDALLAQAVDALMQDARLSPALLTRLEDSLGRAAVFDLMATVGFYSTLGYLLNSCDVPLDNDIAARLAHTPFAP